MKSSFIVTLLFILSFRLWSQTSVPPLEEPAIPLKENFWNLEKYLWSYAHPESMPSGKPMIDFEALDKWPALGNELRMSPDGQFFTYTIERKNEFGVKLSIEPDSLIVKSTRGSWQYAIVDGNLGFFAADSKQYIYETKEGLCLLELGTGRRKIIKNITGYQTPWNDKGLIPWFAWQLRDDDKTVILQNLLTNKELTYKGGANYGFGGSGGWFFCELSGPRKELLIINFEGKERLFSSVVSFVFSINGKSLLLQKSNNSLEFIDLDKDHSETIWSIPDDQSQILNSAFDRSGQQLAFVVRQATGNSIWHWTKGMKKAALKVNDRSTGFDSGLRLGENADFTPDGRFIQFSLYQSTGLRQADSNAAQMDVWSYRDAILQTTQALQLKQPTMYAGIADTAGSNVIQLETGEKKLCFPVTGNYALVSKSTGGDRFWEKENGRDSTWVVSLRDGSYRLLPTRSGKYNFSLSPNGRYLVYFDAEKGCNYLSYDLQTGALMNLTSRAAAFQFGYINPYLRTTAKPDQPAGNRLGQCFAAWVGDEGVLVYDNYDIWQLDLSGKKTAVNITQGHGTKNHTRFWIGNQTYRLDQNDTLLLKAFDEVTKYSGFYRKILGTNGNPELLYMGPCSIKSAICNKPFTGKLSSGNTWLMKKETATETPNVFLTNDLKTFEQITYFAPQTKYTLYTSELHRFKQLDGSISQGILYKPENFDPKKKYPVIISFYGTLTDHLYEFMKPRYAIYPTIFDRPAWIINRGYLLFVPDIYFIEGQWGPSTVNTIDGAAKYLKNLPYVDSAHLGATGHSNSGRFGDYLFTHSSSFAAMSIGAGEIDIISTSLRISENSDKNLLEWAERSSFGAALGNLWKNKKSWIDHSAILQVDNAISPLLLFHNKKDGAIRGGAPLFNALRRLEKKAWWLQYDQGNHSLSNLSDQRDFTIRFTQFFDHYLKGAPAPKWMTEGIPASLKSIEARFEADPVGSCAIKGINKCNVCDAWNKQYRRNSALLEKPISEWKLDKDLQEELVRKERQRHVNNLKGEAERIAENNRKLKIAVKE